MRMAKDQVLAVFLSVAVGVLLPSACTGTVRIYPREIPDVDENGTTELRCYIYRFDGPVTWTLAVDTNTTLHLGTCYKEFGSCISQYNDTRLERNAYYTYLTFFNIQRDMGGRLSCSATDSNNETESDDVLLNVYSKPILENCSLDIVFENWSAVWECDVPRVFSSRGLYSFQIHEAFLCQCAYEASSCLWKNTYERKPYSAPGRCTTHGQISYGPYLTSYINDTENKQYYRGHLVYSWRLPSVSAYNWTVKTYVCAGSNEDTCAYFQQSRNWLGTHHPSTPEHNCADVTYIAETGGDFSCMCKTSYLGEPFGRLLWKRGNTTLVTGGYGVYQLLLPTYSLTTDQEGDEVTCQVDWILAKNAWPPLMVAYGPNNVELRDYLHYDVNDNWILTVECHVTRLNPVNPEMVQWEGLCSGQTGFTCIVNAQETEVDGKIVKCRVTNPENGGRSAEAAKIVKTVKTDLASRTPCSPRPSSTTPPTSETKADDSTTMVKRLVDPWTGADESERNPGNDCLKWAAVGGGVVLAAVVVIGFLVILGICLYRRGLLCSGPVYDSTKTQNGQRASTNDGETHFYEVVAPSVGRGGGDVPLETNPDHTYVNTNFQDQEGHI